MSRLLQSCGCSQISGSCSSLTSCDPVISEHPLWYRASDHITVVSWMFQDHWITFDACIKCDPVIWEHPLHLTLTIRSCYCSLKNVLRSQHRVWSCYLRTSSMWFWVSDHITVVMCIYYQPVLDLAVSPAVLAGCELLHLELSLTHYFVLVIQLCWGSH